MKAPKELQAEYTGPWKQGNEFLPYHHQASHVPPDHRDGWNAGYWAALAALVTAAPQEGVEPQDCAFCRGVGSTGHPPLICTFCKGSGLENYSAAPQPPASALPDTGNMGAIPEWSVQIMQDWEPRRLRLSIGVQSFDIDVHDDPDEPGRMEWYLAQLTVAMKKLSPPGRGMVPMNKRLSYHDVTVSIGEKKLQLADASYGLQLTCTRAGGWELWNNWSSKEELLAGEFHSTPLTIQIGNHVILKPRSATATALGDGEGAR